MLEMLNFPELITFLESCRLLRAHLAPALDYPESAPRSTILHLWGFQQLLKAYKDIIPQHSRSISELVLLVVVCSSARWPGYLLAVTLPNVVLVRVSKLPIK